MLGERYRGWYIDQTWEGRCYVYRWDPHLEYLLHDGSVGNARTFCENTGLNYLASEDEARARIDGFAGQKD